jgi:hypothetical protein
MLNMLMFIIMLIFIEMKHLILDILFHMLNLLKCLKRKINKASTRPHLSFKTFDASYVLTSKSVKVIAKYVGYTHKIPRTCIWVPKVLVSNVKGPKNIWVPKNKT